MMHVRPSEEPHANRFEGVGTRVLIVDVPLEPALDDRRIRRLVGRASIVEDGVVRSLAGQLQWELHHRDQASDLAIEGLVLALLAQLVRVTSTDRGHAAAASRSTLALERAREFIDAHFARVAAARRHRRPSPDCTRRRSRGRSSGGTTLTPWQYQRRRQIEWVKAELQRGDRPIAAIAHEAGFADHSHLTRAFRLAEGMVPSSVKQASQ